MSDIQCAWSVLGQVTCFEWSTLLSSLMWDSDSVQDLLQYVEVMQGMGDGRPTVCKRRIVFDAVSLRASQHRSEEHPRPGS